MPKKTVLVNLEEAWTYEGKTFGPGKDVEVPEAMAQNLVDGGYLQSRQVRPVKEEVKTEAPAEEPPAVAVTEALPGAEEPPAEPKGGRARKGEA